MNPAQPIPAPEYEYSIPEFPNYVHDQSSIGERLAPFVLDGWEPISIAPITASDCDYSQYSEALTSIDVYTSGLAVLMRRKVPR